MVQIGQIQVLLDSKEIKIHGKSLNLGSRAFCILEMLVRARGNLVPKEEIMRRVWPDTVVEENNLQVQICTIRKLLGADRQLIRTVPGRGYLLLHPAASTPDETDAPAAICSALPDQDGPDLVDRESSVQAVTELLCKTRLVTLVGAGGIGKTSLARKIASEVSSLYPAGIVFVPLANVSGTHLVLDAIASALGMSASSSGRVSSSNIAAKTDGKRMLLILDNCEHVIDDAAELAEALLSDSRDVSVLATSREALRTRGEMLYRVPPLDTPREGSDSQEAARASAVRFFLARVQAVAPSFPLHQKSLESVSLICRQLDGIPLAIELAAARAATLGVEVLAEHLYDRLRVLAGGYRSALPRHQTLQATFDWSYGLLDDLERALFRRLGVFVDGFSFGAALQAMDDYQLPPAEILGALSGLVSKSLVTLDCPHASRYSMLQSTRAYALQQLDNHGERKSTSLKHALYVLELFNVAQISQDGTIIARGGEALRSELGNLRTALDWAFAVGGNTQIGVELSITAVPYLYDLTLVDECAKRAFTALQAVKAVQDPLSQKAATLPLLAAYAAALTHTQGPIDVVWNAWSEVMSLAQSNQDSNAEARAIWGLWNTMQLSGRARDALVQAHRFSSLSQHSENGMLSNLALRFEGVAMHYAGNQRAARELLDRMQASCGSRTHRWHAIGLRIDHGIVARATLARVLWLQGEIAESLELSKEAVAAATSYGNDMMTCYILVEAMVPLALLSDDLALATHGISVLRAQVSRAGFVVWSICCDAFEEYRRSMTEEAENGLSGFRAAIEELRRVQFLAPIALFSARLARTLLTAGLRREALKVVSEALTHCEQTGNLWFYAELCRVRAEVALADGRESEVETWLVAAIKHADNQGACGLARAATESLAKARNSALRLRATPVQNSTPATTTPALPNARANADC